MMDWLANFWMPEGLEIESWSTYLSYSILFIFVVVFVFGVACWMSRRAFLFRIVIQSKDDVLTLKRYWWYDLLTMIFLQILFNVLGGVIIIRPLVSSVFSGIIQLTFIEIGLLILLFWITTQIWSPLALKYISPFNIKLLIVRSRRRSTT